MKMFSLLLKLKLKPFCKFQKMGGRGNTTMPGLQLREVVLKSSLFQMLDTISSSEGWGATLGVRFAARN